MEFEVVGEAPDKAPPPQNKQEEGNNITNGNKDTAEPSTSSKGQCVEQVYNLHQSISKCVSFPVL